MPEEKKKSRKKIALFILIPLLVILASVGGYAAYLTNSAKEVVENSQNDLESRKFAKKSDLRETMVDPSVDNISILFLGVDDSEDHVYYQTRTDAMILTTFNEKDKSIKMVNIPRDSRIELVGRGVMDKAAHAHAYGGVDMAVQSVEKLFDIPVDYYVLLNFNAFIEIVDTLGGIQIDVPFEIVEQDSHRNKGAIHLEQGLQTLNGEEALAYARTRKYDSDLARGERQKEVLKAIIEKAVSLKSIGKYKDVLTQIGDNLATNMSFDDMIAFHDYAYMGEDIKIEMLDIKGRSAMINDLYYYILNDETVETISDSFKKHLEIEKEEM